MNRPVVAITHAAEQIPRHFRDCDLDRLRAAAEVRVLGGGKAAVVLPQLAEVDVLLGSWGMPRLDAALLAAAPRLKAVCYAAGSVKGFVTPESYARDVIITTAMAANAVPVAEVTMALITLAHKRWFACQDGIRRGVAAGDDAHAAWRAVAALPHPGNYGATVGLVGLGAIGRLVLERLRAMDLQVLVFDPYLKADEAARLGAEKVDDLVAMAGRCDTLSLHAPNIPACRHMINAAVLKALPDGATFINTARGALVDEAALVAELQTGRISAMLDVTDPEPPVRGHPFWTLPNCWLTPHRAGSSSDEIRRMGTMAIDDALRILAGQAPQHRVLESMLATMA